MIELRRITFFVDDFDKQTAFYKDVLGLEVVEIRRGWSEFRSGQFLIALHKGKGRRPRLEFEALACLEESRDMLNAKGAKLGPIKELTGRRVSAGRDKDGNTVQLSERA